MATAEFDIALDVKQATKSLGSLDKGLKEFGRNAERHLSAFGNVAKRGFANLSDEGSRANRSLGTLAGGVRAFGAVAIGALGFVAIQKFSGALGDTVRAAEDKTAALQGVQFALQRTGQYSRAAFDQVSNFADSLEATKGVSDTAALEMFTLATSFGLTKDQALLAVDAATELSAVNGKDLKESVNAVSKSFNGELGELSKLNPAMKSLTKEQLEAGAAAKFIVQTLGGSAAAKMQDFAGKVSAAGNAFEDLQVSIGKLVTKNPAIIALVEGIGQTFGTLENFVNNNRTGLTKIVGELGIGFAKQIPPMLIALDTLTLGFNTFTAGNKVGTFFDNLALSIGFVTDEILLMARGFLEAKKIASDLGNVLFRPDPDGEDQAKILEDLKKAGLTPEKLAEIQGRAPQILGDLESQGYIKKDEIQPLIEEIERLRANNQTRIGILAEGVQVPPSELPKDNGLLTRLASELTAAILKAEKDLAAGPETKPEPTNVPQTGGEAFTPPEGDIGAMTFDIAKELVGAFGDGMLQLGSEFAQGMFKGGFDGAKQFVGKAGELGAQALGADPATAKMIGQAIEFLGQDPDTFKGAIDGFVKGIPQVIDNIVENIPYLVEVLADNSGEIITALAAASPQIAVAIAKAIPGAFKSLAGELNEGIDYQTKKLDDAGAQFAGHAKGAGRLFEAYFREDMPEDLREAGQAIGQGFEDGLAGTLQGFEDGIGGLIQGIDESGVAFREGVQDAPRIINEGMQQAANTMTAAGFVVDSQLRIAGDYLSFRLDEGGAKTEAAFQRLGNYIGLAVPQKVEAGFAEVSEAVDGITSNMDAAFGNIGSTFANTITSAGDQFWKAADAAGGRILEWFNAVFGGGQDAVSSFKSGGTDGDPSTFYATGGTVPPGYPNDSHHARLSSDELVVPMDDVYRLRRLMDNAEAGGSGMDREVVVMLARIASLLEKQAGAPGQVVVKVGEKAMVQAMLQASRQNERARA